MYVRLMSGLLGCAGILSGCVEERTYLPQVPPAPEAPTLLRPQNHAYLGSIHSIASDALRPRLAWSTVSTEEADPIVYELEMSTTPELTSGVLSFKTSEPAFQPEEALEVSRTAPVGSRYYWRVRACLPRICSSYSPVRWFNLGRSENDYNGDGYADVVVGAPGNGQNFGRAYVYFGGPDISPNSTPDGVLAGAAVGDSFGESVASAGDFDGDGYADLAIGAPTRFDTFGAVDLYFGGYGPTFDPTRDLTFAEPIANAYFGRAISGAGDINGDGLSDLIVGAPGDLIDMTFKGAAYLYLGNARGDRTAAVTFDRAGSGRHLGDRVSRLGDLNNDGLSDVAIGDATNSITNGGASDCNSYLYLGRKAWTASPMPDDQVTFVLRGCRVAMYGVGDINADGSQDILQLAGDTSFPGTATLFLGGGTSSFPTRSLFISDNVRTISGVGDVNGDSSFDIAASRGAGEVELMLFLGQARVPSPFPPTKTLPGQPSTFARSLAGTGDINGDGLTDVVAGDPASNAGSGAATLYLGASGEPGFDFAADATLGSGVADSSFGYAVAAGF